MLQWVAAESQRQLTLNEVVLQRRASQDNPSTCLHFVDTFRQRRRVVLQYVALITHNYISACMSTRQHQQTFTVILAENGARCLKNLQVITSYQIGKPTAARAKSGQTKWKIWQQSSNFSWTDFFYDISLLLKPSHAYEFPASQATLSYFSHITLFRISLPLINSSSIRLQQVREWWQKWWK